MKILQLAAVTFFISFETFGQIEDTGDEVGIGTSSPSSKLEVYQDSGNETIAKFRTNEGTILIAAAGASTGNTTYGNYISSRNAADNAYKNLGFKTIAGIPQFLLKTNGYVGIGSADPLSRLHVKSGNSNASPHSYSVITLEHSSDAMMPILTPNNKIAYYGFADPEDDYAGGMQYDHSSDKLIFRTNNHTHDLTISSNGNVGIGVSAPNNKLEAFRNDGHEIVAQFRTPEGAINIAAAGNSTGNPTYGNYISSRNANDDGYEELGLKAAPGIPQLLVKTNGSVGIGTTTTGSHKLAVGGSIGAREIKVEANGWSDFVFENDYKLKSLEEVEKFITKNKHLPEIPTESEVETNGINLGEMNAKLLQKIEELTLYLIEQNKKLEAQQKRIEELEKKIAE